MRSQPHALVTSIAVAGAIASAATPTLFRRRRKAQAIAPGRSLPIFCLFCLGDWILLKILPLLRLSFSPSILLPLIASLTVRLSTFWGLTAATALARWLKRSRPTRARGGAILFIAINPAFSAIQAGAYVVDPLLVETTELALASDDLDPAAPPVRIVHFTDTHIERSSYRERTVVEKVNALHSDIVVLTGDYINIDYSQATPRPTNTFASSSLRSRPPTAPMLRAEP